MNIENIWKQSNMLTKIILGIYVIAFLGATFNHVSDLVRGGLFPYTVWWGVPLCLNVYWTSLTILDPLAIVLLLGRVRIGCVCYLLIMISDVAINIYADIVYWKQPLLQSHGLMLQTGFLVFLILTVGKIWNAARGAAPRAGGV
jgi:hypothetical protein